MSAIGPGDVVVRAEDNCAGNHAASKPHGLVVGRYYIVSQTISLAHWSCVGGLHLVGVECPYPAGFCAGSFRKIATDPALAEITTRIRNCRPVREREPTNG